MASARSALGLAFVLALVALAQAVTSSAKVERLNDLASKFPHIVRLDGKSFSIFTEAPRNYSIIVLMTATDPSQGCDLCQRFGPEYENVATSWYNLKNPGRLYLGVLEYRAGQEIFVKMKISTAPQILHFPPTEGKFANVESQRDPSKFQQYDLGRGAEAEDFARFVEQCVGQEVPVAKKVDYSGYLFAALAVVALAAIARLAWERFEHILCQPLIWSIMAVGFTLFFISGHAWNSIRGAPFAGREAIAPGFQSQYGVETRLVAFLYGVAAVSFALLAAHVPYINKTNVQRAFAWGYAAAFLIACSAVVAVFRVKYGPYPFRLLF